MSLFHLRQLQDQAAQANQDEQTRRKVALDILGQGVSTDALEQAAEEKLARDVLAKERPLPPGTEESEEAFMERAGIASPTVETQSIGPGDVGAVSAADVLGQNEASG